MYTVVSFVPHFLLSSFPSSLSGISILKNLPFRSVSLLPGLLSVLFLTDYWGLVVYLPPPDYTHKDLPLFFSLEVLMKFL